MGKIIGLTGLSGSGKGTVCKIMEDFNTLVLDCDSIAHRNMEPAGKAYDEIINAFGRGILYPDGTIDRKKLGDIVFSDSKALEKLNSITHRYIKEYVINEIDKNKGKYEYIIIDAPLLLEAGLDSFCDEIWVVYADEDTRLERVMERDNISREKALLRFKNQKDFDRLKEYADFVPDNSGTIEELKAQVYGFLRVGK